MEKSEYIKELAIALSKAQGQIKAALKDTENPFFKSKYADLASCWEAARKPLSDNGLSVVQLPGRNGDEVLCKTMLLHASGQFISSTMSMIPSKKDPQGIGSCLTYLRRYTFSACVGICQDDDDANEASKGDVVKRPTQKQNDEPTKIPTGFQKFLDKMKKAKGHIGNEAYYGILGSEGFEHANEAKNKPIQDKIYQLMLDKAADQTTDKKQG